MAETLLSNDLYLAVLPMINISQSFGRTDQVITLFPDKNFATSFFPDEVEGFITTFKNRADQYLTGGHITGYEIDKEPTGDGRFVVRVTQNVR